MFFSLLALYLQVQLLNLSDMENVIRFFKVFIVLMPAVLWADDKMYLAGAVPEVDGKVVFEKEFIISGVAQDSIYKNAYKWFYDYLKANDNKSGILSSDKKNGQIVAYSEDAIVFSSKALHQDYTFILFNLVITCKQEKLGIRIEQVRFEYYGRIKSAEEMISDKEALNKKKTSIYKANKKFRVNAVDYINDLYTDAFTAIALMSKL